MGKKNLWTRCGCPKDNVPLDISLVDCSQFLFRRLMNVSIQIQTFGCILSYLSKLWLTRCTHANVPYLRIIPNCHNKIEATKYFSATPNDGIIQSSFWEMRPKDIWIADMNLFSSHKLKTHSPLSLSLSPHQFSPFHLCGSWVPEAPTVK